MFYFDGEMAFVGSIPSQLTDNLHLRYSHFVNKSNESFVGDVGIGVYDEADKLIKNFPLCPAWNGYLYQRLLQDEQR